MLWKAVPAVNRPTFCWLEWDFGFDTAVRTDYLVHFSGAATATSETSAVTVSSPEGVSSVIKTHFVSPPLSADKHAYKNMIGYNLLFKNKNGVFNNRLYFSLFLLILQSFYHI